LSAYRFSLVDVTLPGMDDLFGVWEVPPAAATAFGARAEPTWRVELPGSLGGAQVLLEQKARAVRRSEAGLAEAERRLSRVAARVGGVSYGVGGEAGTGRRMTDPARAGEAVLGQPEAELLRALRALDAPVSFAADWHEDAERREVFQRWRAFLSEVRGVVSHYARVETKMAGALVGRTTVGWTGDFDTGWMEGATAPAMALHREAVQLALDSRIALVRLLIVVGAGAAKLGLRLTVPGAQLLVLPAAWTFVRDVLKELREWEQVG
jgi:hypothetical protein